MTSVELAIVGAGPAGLAAGIHAARECVDHVVLECGEPGGLLRAASLVENLPSYARALSGEQIAARMVLHASNLGVSIRRTKALGLRKTKGAFLLSTSSEEIEASGVILATGTQPNFLQAPGAAWAYANDLLHTDIRTLPENLHGIRVIICGGGDAAFDSALSAVRRGAQAEIYVRGETLRAREILVQRALAVGVGLRFGHVLASLGLGASRGDIRVQFKRHTGERFETIANFILLCCGRSPQAELWEEVNNGEDFDSECVDSGIPGLFLAGDLIHGRCRFASVALGDGTMAAYLAMEYLRNKNTISRQESTAFRSINLPSRPTSTSTERKRNMQSQLEIVSCSGNPEVAEVFIGRVANHPDQMVEFVDGLDTRFPREEKWIINVSTQFGCPVGCLFCDAGSNYSGDVPADLIMEQISRVLDRHPIALRGECKKLKVHFSRMGEPSLNPAVIEALDRLPGLIPTDGLMACVATMAPQKNSDWFERLFEVKKRHYNGRFQLQFSINSTDPDWRRRLMPFPHRSLEEIAALGERFFLPEDRKVVLNFALAQGVPVETRILGKLFDPRIFMIKLTPLNPTVHGAEEGLATALLPRDPAGAKQLATELDQQGFEVVVSIGDEREDQIGSNCGQAVRRMTSMAGMVDSESKSAE